MTTPCEWSSNLKLILARPKKDPNTIFSFIGVPVHPEHMIVSITSSFGPNPFFEYFKKTQNSLVFDASQFEFRYFEEDEDVRDFKSGKKLPYIKVEFSPPIGAASKETESIGIFKFKPGAMPVNTPLAMSVRADMTLYERFMLYSIAEDFEIEFPDINSLVQPFDYGLFQAAFATLNTSLVSY